MTDPMMSFLLTLNAGLLTGGTASIWWLAMAVAKLQVEVANLKGMIDFRQGKVA